MSWSVRNVADAPWLTGPHGTWTALAPQGAPIGVNLARLDPGQPASLYHREADQEGFLVLEGDALLLVDGQERPLRQWDYVHTDPWVDHVLVGAGERGCLILLLGGRSDGGVVYPVSELAATHGASARTETDSPREAYAHVDDDVPAAFDADWLT